MSIGGGIAVAQKAVGAGKGDEWEQQQGTMPAAATGRLHRPLSYSQRHAAAVKNPQRHVAQCATRGAARL